MPDPDDYARQPNPGFPGDGYAVQQPRPSAFTAVLAGIFALLAAAAAGYVPIRLFIDIPSGFSLGDLPGSVLADLGIYLGCAFFLLLGALATFFRTFAGAILLILGALLGVAAVLIEPSVQLHGNLTAYLRVVFSFADLDLIVRAMVIVLVPLVLLLAILPPTIRYLRFRPTGPQVYGQPPAYEGQGW